MTLAPSLLVGVDVGGTFTDLVLFAEAAANELTHAALDPVAKIPEYKVCAVALSVLRP